MTKDKRPWQSHHARILDKLFVWSVCGGCVVMVLFVLALWAFGIAAAVHFVSKYW